MTRTTVYISSDGSETGALLRDMLQERGVYAANGPAAVCYGVGGSIAEPALNTRCRSDKITRMQRMGSAGVQLVPWARGLDAMKLRFPLFARRMYGMGAKDLMPCFQPEEVRWRLEAGWEWFSSIVPIHQELRAWIWRGEVLQMFEKRMVRPQQYTAMGRNFGQGFEFAPVDVVQAGAADNAILATRALDLDFAAIDMIFGKDGQIYVLEANTAPGAIRSGAQATLAKLADRITDWCRKDCPRERR